MRFQNGFSEKNTFLFYPFISMYNTLGYVKKITVIPLINNG